MVVGRGTIHHEGAGEPSNTARGAAGGYTYWVGSSKWTRLRSVASSWATYRFNHVSVDVCLSGNREVYPTSANDVKMIGECFADARSKGEVTPNPTVLPHRWSPGSSTVCPGRNTMAVWDSIVAACRGGNVPAPPPTKTHPTLFPGAHGAAVKELQHKLNVGTGNNLAEDGAYGPQTTGAVSGMQAFFKLDVDGICGPKTWGMVDYCYALKGGK